METPAEPKSINIWQLKPWWCQPWSIVLTGVGVIAITNLLFKTIWITGLVALPILIWMGYFLLIYPKAMAQMLAQESAPAEEVR